jgi:PAS domain S-box-containing protein
MSSSIRVLHLEDSPRDAEMIRERLEAADVVCEIVLANSKESFEAALTRKSFDLIISAYNLPGYDGVAALKQAQAKQPDVPMILIAGTLVKEVAIQCLQIGATDYLLKGCLDRLVPAVERAFQEAETRRARKRVEGALAESEARKAAILDSVLDCIVTMDADGLVIEFNAAAERTFGYTKAQAIGRTLADLIIPPALRAAHSAGLARYLATNEGRVLGKVIEMTAMRSDGSELPVELAITAIHSEEAPVFTGVLRDITARKREDETRTRLAAIVDSSDDAIFSVALDDTILTWNADAERLYGYTASEMIGQSRATLALGRSAEFATILENAIRGEAGEPFETQRIRKDGSIIDISLAISPIRDSTGRVTSVSAIARDITSRRKGEVERNQAVEAVQTAEERMRFALESAGVGIWDLDYATGSLRWSETLEAQYGLRPGTFDGTFEAFMARIHPDDRESVLETIGKAMASGVDFTIQNRSIWPDGTVQWLNGAGRIRLGPNGKPVRGVGISQNVTDRKRAEAELTRLNDEIQLQRLRVFKATMRTVHDIVNNLLNGFQLVRFEGESQLPAEMVTLIDQMIEEASGKLKALGDLETVNEKEMAVGLGIEYPGSF